MRSLNVIHLTIRSLKFIGQYIRRQTIHYLIFIGRYIFWYSSDDTLFVDIHSSDVHPTIIIHPTILIHRTIRIHHLFIQWLLFIQQFVIILWFLFSFLLTLFPTKDRSLWESLENLLYYYFTFFSHEMCWFIFNKLLYRHWHIKWRCCKYWSYRRRRCFLLVYQK